MRKVHGKNPLTGNNHVVMVPADVHIAMQHSPLEEPVTLSLRPLHLLVLSVLLLAGLSLIGCAEGPDSDRVLTPVDEDATTLTDAGHDDTFDDDAHDDVRDAAEPDGSSQDVATGDTEVDANNPNGLCRPNRDGVIERHEAPLAVGQHATFKIGVNATVNTAGTMVDGTQTWDLSGDLAGDRRELIELRNPADMWFSTSFPTATYFTRLSASSNLLGVFRITDDALILLGVVSEAEGFTRTELKYDPPVDVLRFPFEEGTTWTVESRVTGVASGIAVLYDETYVYTVDKSGELKTPFGDFEVLRIRSDLERVVGLVTTRLRTYLFASECFGTVATIVSKDNESSVEFTEAAEVRRLAP